MSRSLACTGGIAIIAAALAAPAIAADRLVVSETIVVTGRQEPMGASSFETRHGLDIGKIDPLRAASADEIVRRLPAVHVPVNSRGEAIAFVRNAAERQVAIFYEGADINVPLDNRLDLSLVPDGKYAVKLEVGSSPAAATTRIIEVK